MKGEGMNSSASAIQAMSPDGASAGSEPSASKKIVTNRCHGGFGLSEAAMVAYAARKGLTLYPEAEHGMVTYWTVPPEERPAPLTGEAWFSASMEEKIAANDAYDAASIYDKDIPRDDPDLIAVVEALGPEAAGAHAKLDVTEIPADVEWKIEEYDGLEWVAEVHRTW